jgi:hypothetical protein
MALFAVVAFAGCATAPELAGATAPNSTGIAVASGSGHLTVFSPPPNSTVATSSIEVSGTAPAGARIVQDISFGPDQETTADASGGWQLTVKLNEGANDLVFRIGDDRSTELKVTVTYAPATIAPAPATPTPAPQTDTPATPTPFVPTPAPTHTFVTFGDGIYTVGSDIRAGTYRLREIPDFCYWERLKGFSGELGDIIANENADTAWAVATIKSTDKGFNSEGCGEWSSDLSRVTASKSRLDDDGTYIVGTDLSAGTWRATGGEYCYWARLSGFGGTLSNIVANGNVLGNSVIVTIRSTDKGFHTQGCGTWTRS